jgi:glycosyltransferase involved in cell wall biosynthesis
MTDFQPGKIWMISASFYPWIGGAELQLQRISKILLAENYSLKVLTRRHREGLPKDLPAEDSVDGVPIRRLYSRGSSQIASLLFTVGGLWHLFWHGRRSIYYANGPGAPAWLAVIAQYLFGGRSIIKVRSGSYNYSRLYLSHWWRAWLFVLPLRLASRAVVVSKDGACLMHTLGIPEHRVVHIPNGIDTDFFCPVSQETKPAICQQLGFATDKTIVLYAGRLDCITKGVDLLVRAWAGLSSEMRESALLIILGDGPDRDKVIGLIKSLGVEHSIVMMGSKQEVRDYYWASDIFVLPSRDEGLSNALLEAMACGLPVVASNVGGTLDVVQHGKNGFLYKAEGDRQLTQQLSSILQMRIQWNEMGMYGRKVVISHASFPVVVDRLKELYGPLAGN